MNPMQSPNTGPGRKLCSDELYGDHSKPPHLQNFHFWLLSRREEAVDGKIRMMKRRHPGARTKITFKSDMRVCQLHDWACVGIGCPECAKGNAPRHCNRHGWSHLTEGCPDCAKGNQ